VVPRYLEERIGGRSWGVGQCNPGQYHFAESERAAGCTLILSVMAVALLVSPSTAESPMMGVRRVLIINDIDIISSPGFGEVDQAVLTALQKSPYRIELNEESLDVTLFPDRVSQDRFREEIIQKYSARKPDVIIAVGPASLKFIAELYDRFQGTPIIFCAIWGGIPDLIIPSKELPIEVTKANVDGLRLQPDPGGDVRREFRMDSFCCNPTWSLSPGPCWATQCDVSAVQPKPSKHMVDTLNPQPA
jgi:hypothetical protein